MFKKKHMPLATLMCPVQITNDIDSILLTVPAINEHFVHQPPMSKIIQTFIIQTMVKFFKNKRSILGNNSLHLYANLQLKIQNTNISAFHLSKFDIWRIST